MNWTDYFLNIATQVSLRSKDIHTKHGCVLVKYNKIIGTGYNSFPRGMEDSRLPTSRPEKYRFMLHSETNALLNMTLSVSNFTAYVTGEPCFDCLIRLWQAGCDRIIFLTDGISKCIDEEDKRLKQTFFTNLITGNPTITTLNDSVTIWDFQ